MKAVEQQFIDNTLSELDSVSSTSIERSSELNTVLSQYTSTLKDYVEAKRKYIDFLDKYQSKVPEHAVTASLPGVNAAMPAYSNEEMVSDTGQMQEIGELVKELREQLDVLEYEITSQLGALIQTVQVMGGLKDRTISYLDQYIEAISGAYDAGFLVADINA